MVPKRLLTIGSADTCDIVVTQPTVSRTHCSLEWIDASWTLRDLGSTNGTFVNGERLSNPRVLKPSDQVTLGRGIPLTIPIVPTKEVAASSILVAGNPDRPGTAGKFQRGETDVVSQTWLLPAVIVGASSLVLVGLVIGLGFDRAASKSTDTTKALATAVGEASLPKIKPLPPEPIPSIGQKAVKPTTPFYAVVVESKDGKERLIVGTAVAIEPFFLLTLGSILTAVDEFKNDFPSVLLYPSEKEGEILEIATKIFHPGYLKSLEDYRQFQRDFSENSAKNEENEATLEDKLKWSGRYEKIVVEMMRSDFACLGVKSELTNRLSLPEAGKQPGSAGDCRLIGFPLIVPPPRLKDGVESFFLNENAKWKADSSTSSLGLTVESVHFSGLPLESLLCVDSNNGLIGICVRETKMGSLETVQRALLSKPERFWK